MSNYPTRISAATRRGLPVLAAPAKPQPATALSTPGPKGPGQGVTGAQARQAELDQQKLDSRVAELTKPNLVSPALIDPAEVEIARAKFKTPIVTLSALETMASLRLAWLAERNGFKPAVTLTTAQREAAAQFFTTHPDKPPVEESPAPVPAVAPAATATPPAVPPAPAKTASEALALVSIASSVEASFKVQLAILGELKAMRGLLEQIASNSAPAAPNYKRPYSAFPNFDWASIGAIVTTRDSDGVSAVECNGYDYTRRAGANNKFGKAIWFSRPTGKDADGNNTYARLITFKDQTEAEPLPRK